MVSLKVGICITIGDRTSITTSAPSRSLRSCEPTPECRRVVSLTLWAITWNKKELKRKSKRKKLTGTCRHTTRWRKMYPHIALEPDLIKYSMPREASPHNLSLWPSSNNLSSGSRPNRTCSNTIPRVDSHKCLQHQLPRTILNPSQKNFR